jgi:hypothetical protein
MVVGDFPLAGKIVVVTGGGSGEQYCPQAQRIFLTIFQVSACPL